jgi:intracellular multiplication protein IcmE
MSDDSQKFDEDTIDFSDDSGGESFEDFEGGSGTSLGDMWRNNPLVKVGVIAGGLITVIGAIVLFGGGEDPALTSVVRGGNTASQAPGTGEVSDVYRQAVEDVNAQRQEEAIRTGTSAMPTPIDTPIARLNIGDDSSAEEDPLERWRRIQEERNRRNQQVREQVPTEDPNLQLINQLAQAMSQQMEELLTASDQAYQPMQVDITPADFVQAQRLAEFEAQQQAAIAQQEALLANPDPETVDIIVPVGTLGYGQLITEANSDADNAILAQLVSGPLAGSRLIGSFEIEDDFLVLTFNTIVVDGIAQSADILALEPSTTAPGLVTDINRRYFRRIILPAAAGFIQGVGSAIAETGSTNVTVSGDTVIQEEEDLDLREELFSGVESAAETIGGILTEEANDVEPLIRVAAGTPLGLLFLTPVVEND